MTRPDSLTPKRLAEIRTRLTMTRLGLSASREMDRDILAIRDLLAEVDRLRLEKNRLSGMLRRMAARATERTRELTRRQTPLTSTRLFVAREHLNAPLEGLESNDAMLLLLSTRADVRVLLMELDRMRATESRIRQALSNHPHCEMHDDDEPITCGWRFAVADITEALEATHDQT